VTGPTLAPAHATGCLLCGAALVYSERTEVLRCDLCGASQASTARCADGHFACDACHGGTAKDAVERICSSTEERDPIAIAVRAMRHPLVKMHGPEHHFLVPAALVAAWSNARGEPERRAGRVAEVRRRSDPVAGGFCGVQGACGAGIGAGTFVSVATGATPLTGDRRGLANLATARALEAIAATGGARCCKRDSWLSLLTAARFSGERLGVELPVTAPRCEFSASNRQCLQSDCPFHAGSAAVPAATVA
jgi:hypothetical protein